MMRQRRRRRCLCCKELFLPDPRSRYHQRFCSKVQCQKASKALSQARWRAKFSNQNYWRGAAEVERVRSWRKAHPGYWKKKAPQVEGTLQDDCSAQVTENEQLNVELDPAPLQEDSLVQHPLMVGLISMLTTGTLQEDIASTRRRLIARGHEILGMVPGARLIAHEQKTPGSGASAPTPQPV
jgi:hypothetical protein